MAMDDGIKQLIQEEQERRPRYKRAVVLIPSSSQGEDGTQVVVGEGEGGGMRVRDRDWVRVRVRARAKG